MGYYQRRGEVYSLKARETAENLEAAQMILAELHEPSQNINKALDRDLLFTCLCFRAFGRSREAFGAD
ncbi:MAG: hypothetical protein R2865_15910 [Deinococcales bacterium]